jgi:hypothetical protein
MSVFKVCTGHNRTQITVCRVDHIILIRCMYINETLNHRPTTMAQHKIILSIHLAILRWTDNRSVLKLKVFVWELCAKGIIFRHYFT